MNRRRIIFIGICLIIVAGVGLWAWNQWKGKNQPQPLPEPVAKTQAYFIFSDLDNGSTTPVTVGSTVIVNLPDTLFTDSIAAKDQQEKMIPLTHEIYNHRIIVSFPMSTTSLYVSAEGVSGSNPYALTLLPQSETKK